MTTPSADHPVEGGFGDHLIADHGIHPDRLDCLSVADWEILHREIHEEGDEGVRFLETTLHVPAEVIQAALNVGGYRIVENSHAER